MKISLLITLLNVVLFTAIVNAQTAEIKDSTDLKSKLRADFEEMLKYPTTIWKFVQNKGTLYGSEKNILVMENGLQLRRDDEITDILFLDMADYNIRIMIEKSTNYVEVTFGDFLIVFQPEGKEKVKKMANEKIEKLANDLILSLDKFNKKRFKEVGIFEPIASRYRSLKVKPPLSEGQRKYIVQANSYNEKKMYAKAIELYNKVNKIDQTGYPAAYSNLALLWAQIQKYDAAIYYMKKYLLLEPEGADARSAQDKIYEWETQLTQ